jgi:hypothetical protein
MTLTTYLLLVLRLKMVALYLHSSTHLHGVVVNKLDAGTTSPFPVYCQLFEQYSNPFPFLDPNTRLSILL